MEKQNDETVFMMNKLQEREREQILIQSICKTLAQATTIAEFGGVVSSLLKEQFNFDDFIFAASEEIETEYQVFYQFSVKEVVKKSYATNDGFFEACLDSADNVVFDLKKLRGKNNNLPEYISKVQNYGFNNGVGVCLPSIKGNRNVLFLFFKNAALFTRESNRILTGIATQLSITGRNIIMAEKYEIMIAELNILKNNLSENKIQTKNQRTEGFCGIVGNSEVMQNVYKLINQVAAFESTVLIFGETGTGKELVASAVHSLSAVSNKRMIKVNCASIPVNLIESELFGHEKGAFTDATESRIGKFEQAENSTIFLDEIGELPLELQGKLLRVLQEKEIERIGGKKTIKVNARVIVATNKSLEIEVAEGRFRSDLYYRLNVFPISLPALRERPEDIALLGNFFLEKHASKIGKKIKGFSKKVLNKMQTNAWTGNVRELENMVERSVLFTNEEVIKEMIFPRNFLIESNSAESEFYPKTLQEIEREHILKVVKKCNGRISGPQGAAILLDMPSTTLISKMQKLGIKKGHF